MIPAENMYIYIKCSVCTVDTASARSEISYTVINIDKKNIKCLTTPCHSFLTSQGAQVSGIIHSQVFSTQSCLCLCLCLFLLEELAKMKWQHHIHLENVCVRV